MWLTATVLRGSRGNERSKRLDAKHTAMVQCRSCPFGLAVAKNPLRFPCPSTWYRVMPVYHYCNLIDLKVNSGQRLVLRCQQQAVGQQAGMAAERALGSDPCQLRKIIAFR